MKLSSARFSPQTHEGEKGVLNSELWHACAGPLVSLPLVGSRVVYFPQGHSEQVTASTNKEVDAQIPNYQSLPPQLICQLHNVTMHADVETDEVYAQMTLQPLGPQEQKDPYLPAELGGLSRHPTNYFCKTLTASDTSTHGGFSVPRRAAEKVFPPLDFSQQPPVQELIARDLHENEWKFRHIFRGQPKRHLLTSGWSVFVNAKRLIAGDSVLFIWNDKNQLLLGIRRANRPQTVMPLSVLSSDSMHLGLLAAAAHAAATNSRFTIFYNPRASPSEFIIPLAKYVKAVYHIRVSVGMRFRMLFETQESSVRRYMGTITGISDLDPVRWLNSHWRSVKVGWDESTAGDRQPRVSLWEIEPLTTFPTYPSPFSLRFKRPWPPGLLPSFHGLKDVNLGLDSSLMWDRGFQSPNFQGNGGVTSWDQPRLDASMLSSQNDIYQVMAAAALQDVGAINPPKPPVASFLQFQQPSSFATAPMYSMQCQTLQQLSQQAFLGVQESSQSVSQAQTQQQQMVDDHNLMVMASVSSVSQFASASQPLCHQQCFSNSNGYKPMTSAVVSPLHTLAGNFPQDESSQPLNLPRSSSSLASTGWPSKRAAVDPSFLPTGAPPFDMARLRPSSANNISQSSGGPLPPFPGRDCSIDQEASMDPHSHVLFGFNIEPSSLLTQNRMSNLQGIGTESDSVSVPLASSNSLINRGKDDFSANPVMMPPSFIDESGFLQSSGNAGSENPGSATFVKVYKLGSYGRSLDISKFSSYQELRSELGHMFGLEGRLEDPLRSGWQLVFVDRENDVLLLGDDPWPEFVNSVWCIKILSPEEVQEMGKRGMDLLNSAPSAKTLSNGSHDYENPQDSINSGNIISSSMGSLDY